MNLRYKFHDGGRRDAGFKGHAGDCVTRAIAIALDQGYRETYTALADLCAEMTGGLERSARGGLPTPVSYKYLIDRGWELVRTDGAYFHAEQIPVVPGWQMSEMRIIAVLPRHQAAVIDGVVMDAWDSRKSNRTKCGAPKLLGFYSPP